MDQHVIEYLYNEILVSNKNKPTTDILHHMMNLKNIILGKKS